MYYILDNVTRRMSSRLKGFFIQYYHLCIYVYLLYLYQIIVIYIYIYVYVGLFMLVHYYYSLPLSKLINIFQ